MATKILKKVVAIFLRVLYWTPAVFLFSDRINSLPLFNKFKRNEVYFQLKVVLAGIVGFTAIFGASFQTGDPHFTDVLPWGIDAHYYSCVVSILHVFLVAIAIQQHRLHRLVIFRSPWILAAVSYLLLLPLIIKLTFNDGIVNSRLYVISSSLLLFVATLYYQQSFIVSAMLWSSIYITRILYLFTISSAALVSPINGNNYIYD